jgi:hypothetical protein
MAETTSEGENRITSPLVTSNSTSHQTQGIYQVLF